MTKFKSNTIDSGVGLRQEEVIKRLRELKFEGEYLLVSTKMDSVYSNKLKKLPPKVNLIVDLYTPLLLEKELTLSKWRPQDWITRRMNKQTVKKFLERGNHFLVANRRQSKYWMELSKQLKVPLLEKDISVLPTGSGLRPSTFNLRPSARRNVALWFGGIYPWMNPKPLVEAFERLAPKFPKWRLRFLGGWQPGTGYEKSYLKIKKLAEKIIPGYQVEFIPWQAQEKLSKYLADVGLAVHLVKPTPEDYYAHRVRLLSLTNAGIPVVTSGEDVISDLIVKIGSGKRVKNDSGKIAAAIFKLIKSPKALRNLGRRAEKIEQLFIQQEVNTAGSEKFL